MYPPFKTRSTLPVPPALKLKKVIVPTECAHVRRTVQTAASDNRQIFAV